MDCAANTSLQQDTRPRHAASSHFHYRYGYKSIGCRSCTDHSGRGDIIRSWAERVVPSHTRIALGVQSSRCRFPSITQSFAGKSSQLCWSPSCGFGWHPYSFSGACERSQNRLVSQLPGSHCYRKIVYHRAVMD